MYILTGAAGFIGSAILAKLNQQGIKDVLIVDQIGTSASWKNLVNKKYYGYIHKSDFIKQVREHSFKGFDIKDISAIIHMGACSSTTEEDMDFLFENNFNYTRDLAQFALTHDIRFINASSAATYGAGEQGYIDEQFDIEALKPLNRYGYSKQLFDLWAKNQNVQDKIVSLKFFNVYGPNEYHKGSQASVILHAYNQIKKTGSVSLFKSYKPEYKDGEQKRDFIYVKDCVGVIFWLLESRFVNGLFNLGTGQARSWNDLAASVFSAMQQPIQINYIDMPDNLKGQYQYFTQATMSKLKNTGCPVEFHSLEDGARDYVQNYLVKEMAIW